LLRTLRGRGVGREHREVGERRRPPNEGPRSSGRQPLEWSHGATDPAQPDLRRRTRPRRGTVERVHEGIIDADLAQRAWRAIDERRTRQPEPRGPALGWDRDPYMLRGLLRCAGCERVMTTSASTRVTIDNADEVPRYYRCRGDAERPACTPRSRSRRR